MFKTELDSFMARLLFTILSVDGDVSPKRLVQYSEDIFSINRQTLPLKQQSNMQGCTQRKSVRVHHREGGMACNQKVRGKML